VIVLPHPPASLSANARCHWSVKARDTKAVREYAGWQARLAMQHDGITEPWPAAQLHIWWQFAGKQPDDESVIARCKPARDALVDAGLLTVDRYVRQASVTLERVPRKEQGVVITVTRADTPAERDEE
jgi:hypothetical protein